jgi:predicted AAA+ superfamily ATPase
VEKTHLDIILRQDLIDLEIVKNVKQIELLIVLLKTRVGSPISYHSLAQAIRFKILRIYVIFKRTPYSKNIARSVLKMPRYYFYDVRATDPGARLENLVAAYLLKEITFARNVWVNNGD